jgi:hypothetical protein
MSAAVEPAAQDSSPARGYSWEPFQPGHELSTRHGAYSPRKLDPLATEIAAGLLADESVAHLRQPRFAAAVQAWAVAEARCQLIAQWCEGMTIQQAATPPKPGTAAPLEVLRKWEATALTHRARLGLDPLSASRLAKDVAQGRQADAARMLTELREQHERASHAEVIDDD